MRKLIRLENGTWVEPSTITRIQVFAQCEFPRSGGGVTLVMDRVIVSTNDGQATCVEYGSDTEAYAQADKLAMIVNESRDEDPK